MIGGLALLSDYVDDRRISFPFPLTTGTWTSHAFCATFRAGALIKPPVKRFREWLLAQSAITQRWVEEKVRTSLSPPALSNIKTTAAGDVSQSRAKTVVAATRCCYASRRCVVNCGQQPHLT